MRCLRRPPAVPASPAAASPIAGLGAVADNNGLPAVADDDKDDDDDGDATTVAGDDDSAPDNNGLPAVIAADDDDDDEFALGRSKFALFLAL